MGVPGRSLAAAPGGGSAIALGRAPCSRGARPRAPPRAPSASGGRPLGRAWGTRGHRRLRGGSSSEAQRTGCREDASVRGASPPSGHQSPDTSEIRLWVCGERNATQTPFPPKPRADKHAQARTQTSPRPALAAAGSCVREEPGDQTGSLPSPGSPGRGRSPSPLAGATEVSGVTGPEQRRNGRSGPAASAARAGRERPPDTAGCFSEHRSRCTVASFRSLGSCVASSKVWSSIPNPYLLW
ncbi:collagen alpha-1(I) chain-like [Mesocricetus auratus]|uniref:Collagen alpha-1(I) chain-like n=1 Tax=Mesocricetus auratus TaxID=10036 RepID=A0ABM2XY08_MESAU|nr:collagen alpha-1(I) chain-like [Mesocricetus auratus]